MFYKLYFDNTRNIEISKYRNISLQDQSAGLVDKINQQNRKQDE